MHGYYVLASLLLRLLAASLPTRVSRYQLRMTHSLDLFTLCQSLCVHRATP